MKSDDLGILATSGWLAEQPADFREEIRALGRWRHFDAGQSLFDAGEAADGLVGVADGALEITLPLVGEEVVTIYRTERCFWIGDSSILCDAVRLVSAHAARPSRVFFVPAAAIRAMVARQPAYWPHFYRLSHINVHLAITLLAEALSLSPAARLARRLDALADPAGVVNVSQFELAAVVGATRGTVQRALATLVDEGAVMKGYRTIRIVDRNVLRKICDRTAS